MQKQTLFIKLRPALAIAGLVLIFFARLAFTPLIIAQGDALTYFYPYWHAAAGALRAGRLPLWNDMIFMGAPFMANGQVGLFYPPNFILWLLNLSTPTTYTLSLLIHLIWAGLGMLALLRAAMHTGWPGALSGAGLFALGGTLTAHIGQINQLQGMAWLPWLFLLLDLSRRKPLRWGPVLAAALAMQTLTGHTQTLFIGGVGMGVAALWWAWRIRESKRFAGPVALVVAGGAALLLTLPQLAPMLELSGLSNRAEGLHINEVVSFSLHPFLFGRAMLPNYSVALHSEFIGTVGIGGLALALAGAWWARKDPHWQAWIAVTATGLVLGLGKWNQFYWKLGLLPGFNLFRVPARWMALWAIGASVLAAYGIHRMWNDTARFPKALILLLGGGVLGLAGITFLAPQAKGLDVAGQTAPQPIELVLWLVTLSAVSGIMWFLRGRRAAGGLAGLALLELFAVSHTMPMPYNRLAPPETFSELSPTIRAILELEKESPMLPAYYLSIADIDYAPGDQAEIEARYAGYPDEAIYDYLTASKLKAILAPNLGMVWNIATVDGYDGGVLPLRSWLHLTTPISDEPAVDGRLYERLSKPPSPDWLGWLSIKYLLLAPDMQPPGDQWRLVWSGDVDLYEGPGLSVFLTDTLEAGEPVVGETKIIDYTPEAVTLEADSPTGGYLWMMGSYYPGWVATVDGEPVEVDSAIDVFRAVRIPAGKHTVQMTFRPTSWPAAWLVSGVMWIVLAGAAIFGWRQTLQLRSKPHRLAGSTRF